MEKDLKKSEEKYINAMKLLGDIESVDFLLILSRYFKSKADFIKSINELEENKKRTT